MSESPLPPVILARVVKTIQGKFSRWDVGELVKVVHDDGVCCSIERQPWKGAEVELMNKLAGVPRAYLRFGESDLKTAIQSDPDHILSLYPDGCPQCKGPLEALTWKSIGRDEVTVGCWDPDCGFIIYPPGYTPPPES